MWEMKYRGPRARMFLLSRGCPSLRCRMSRGGRRSVIAGGRGVGWTFGIWEVWCCCGGLGCVVVGGIGPRLQLACMYNVFYQRTRHFFSHQKRPFLGTAISITT